jgi:hypothetical protein
MTEKFTPAPVRTGFEKKAQQMRVGLEKYLPPGETLVLNGKRWTQDQLVAVLQSAEQLYADVRDARAALRQKLLDRQAKVRPHAELVADLANALRGYHGRASPKLAEHGIRAGARPPRSSQAVTLAAAKAKLTRKARHTLGSKQKLAIRAPGNPSLVIFSPDGKPLDGKAPASPPLPPNDKHGPSG